MASSVAGDRRTAHRLEGYWREVLAFRNRVGHVQGLASTRLGSETPLLRTYLVLAPRRSDSLGAFLENLERRRREEGVEPLSEEEAMSLANEEVHAMRRDHPGVLISAAISGKGASWEVLRRWVTGEFDLVVSPRLLHELQAVPSGR